MIILFIKLLFSIIIMFANIDPKIMSLYIPEESPDLIIWAQTFKETFPAYAQSNGFPEGQIKVALSACDQLITICEKSIKLGQEGKHDEGLELEKAQFAHALACLYNK
jgi:hypothetical protein